MNGAFLDAEVTGYESLITSMTCDEKDRHVLAAAVRADAGAIVTFNTSDFPPQSTEVFEIDVIHPGEFLLDPLDLAPVVVLEELMGQAAANRRDPKTLPALLGVLDRSGVSAFTDEIRRRVT